MQFVTVICINGSRSCIFQPAMGAAHSQRWSNYSFSTFFAEKSSKMEEKARKLRQNSAKNVFFVISSERWSICFFLGLKPLTFTLVQSLKNIFWLNFASIFLLFSLFCVNNVEKVYFYQHLDCAES